MSEKNPTSEEDIKVAAEETTEPEPTPEPEPKPVSEKKSEPEVIEKPKKKKGFLRRLFRM